MSVTLRTTTPDPCIKKRLVAHDGAELSPWDVSQRRWIPSSAALMDGKIPRPRLCARRTGRTGTPLMHVTFFLLFNVFAVVL